MPAGLNFPKPVVATLLDPMGSFVDHRAEQSTAVIFHCGQANPNCLSLPEWATALLLQLFFSSCHVCYRLARVAENTTEQKYEEVIRIGMRLFSKHGKWRMKLT